LMTHFLSKFYVEENPLLFMAVAPAHDDKQVKLY
jgi:hypothetical protein